MKYKHLNYQTWEQLIDFTGTVPSQDQTVTNTLSFNSMSRKIILEEVTIQAVGEDALSGRIVLVNAYMTCSGFMITQNMVLANASVGHANMTSTSVTARNAIGLISDSNGAHWRGKQPLNGQDVTLFITIPFNSVQGVLNDSIYLFITAGYNEDN